MNFHNYPYTEEQLIDCLKKTITEYRASSRTGMWSPEFIEGVLNIVRDHGDLNVLYNKLAIAGKVLDYIKPTSSVEIGFNAGLLIGMQLQEKLNLVMVESIVGKETK